jgi:sugar O-acyltransferase (sialic acid O-acetyltransferase NeuD family)
MSKPGIVLLGAGGHAHACVDVIEQEAIYQIVGLIGQPDEVGFTHFGYTVIGDDTELESISDKCDFALVAIGQIKSAQTRQKLFQRVSDAGMTLPTIVSPRAYVSPRASVGKGSIVMHGAVVNAGARIGENCIVNSFSLVEHDVVISDHSHISTGARVNGGSKVGNASFIGSGSVIKEGVTIGNSCIVGMSMAVKRDLPDGSLMADNTI